MRTRSSLDADDVGVLPTPGEDTPFTESQRLWLEAGRTLLIERGHLELNIANLLPLVGKTIGSFYYQFQSIDDYIATLALYCVKRTEAVFARIEKDYDGPMERLQRLGDVSAQTHSWRASEALSAWARTDAKIERLAARGNAVVVRFLVRCFEGLGFDKEEAELRAKMLYIVQNSPFHTGRKEVEFRTRAFHLLLRPLEPPAKAAPRRAPPQRKA